ncbi:hypothetical protein BDV06DRAFT_116201 [Aspergillus oleicola]
MLLSTVGMGYPSIRLSSRATFFFRFRWFLRLTLRPVCRALVGLLYLGDVLDICGGCARASNITILRSIWTLGLETAGFVIDHYFPLRTLCLVLVRHLHCSADRRASLGLAKTCLHLAYMHEYAARS